MTIKERKRRVETAVIEQNGICPVCGYGKFCKECVRGKGPESPHKHEYQTLNTFDQDHNCCKVGCEKCFRGALHDFCNRRILPVWEAYFKRFGFVESLSQEDRDFLVGVNPGWAKFGYVDCFSEVRAYLQARIGQ